MNPKKQRPSTGDAHMYLKLLQDVASILSAKATNKAQQATVLKNSDRYANKSPALQTQHLDLDKCGQAAKF